MELQPAANQTYHEDTQRSTPARPQHWKVSLLPRTMTSEAYGSAVAPDKHAAGITAG